MKVSRKTTSPLRTALSNQIAFVEFSLIVVLVALGVSLTAAAIAKHFESMPECIGVLGVGFIFIGFLYALVKLIRPRKQELALRGTVFINKESKAFVDVSGYKFASQLSDLTSAAFKENKALLDQWTKGALGYPTAIRADKNSPENRAARLLEEVTEYFVVTYLSTHLTDYFNRKGLSQKRLITLERDHIPHILLSNRFLSLFSGPTHDRPGFSEGITNCEEGEVILALSDGIRFEKFDLVLPKRSKLTRDGKRLVISTPRLSISIGVLYCGYSGTASKHFVERYIKLPYHTAEPRLIEVQIAVNFKLLGMLLGKWDYYQWVDSFLEGLARDISFKRFLKTIKWRSIEAILECRSDDEPLVQ